MSGPINFDRVKVACATTGTGTLTLGSAVTGFRAVPAAADGKLLRVYVEEVDGSGVPNGAWETFVGLYTHSGTTLTRGTFRDSSTGSAINFGATKYVSIAGLAGEFRSTATGTDANATLVTNTDLELDISAWATADRILTLPVAAAGVAIGDIIEVGIAGGNASYEAIIKTGSGETCTDPNGGTDIASASEITRLFITGEHLRFKRIGATKWRVYDGRKAQQCTLRLSTNAAAEDVATVTRPTTKSGVWTADIDRGGIAVAASDQINCRRAGNVRVAFGGSAVSSVADGKYFGCYIYKNGTSQILINDEKAAPVAGTSQIRSNSGLFPFAVDDYIVYQWRSEEGSRGLNAAAAPRLITFMSLAEEF